MGVTHMVSAGHYLAASAGYRILEQGGNAVDAGVASGIAINVTLPNATNFGGVAPIIIYLAESDQVVTISGLGRWPRAASIDHFMKNAGGQIPLGILRCVVPSAADAWLTALEKYGTMSFEQVVGPALELADGGFPLSEPTASSLRQSDETLEGDLATWESTRAVFMPSGRAPKAGEPLVQKDLARTFTRLIEVERADAHRGRAGAIRAARDYFYKGDIADEIAAFSDRMGGLLTLDDLREFSVKVEEPESGKFRDYEIFTCGPWCQGPVVAQTLQMLEDDDLASYGHNSADYVHLVFQAMNLAFADRHYYYGDPDHVDVPMEGLLSKGYTKARRSVVDMERAFGEMAPPGEPWAYQNGEGRSRTSRPPVASAGGLEQDTSYTCVVDRWGNAFSATPSDGLFGSPVVPGLGLIISSRGTQSWLDPEHASSLQPWKRPRLTPNPAMAFKNGKLFMPFGTPGGDAQCPAMVQTFLNIAEFGMDPQAAIEAARFVPWNFPNSFWPHTYLPGRIHVEGRVSKDVNGELERRGHELKVLDDWSPGMGSVSAITVDHESGVLKGGADPRRDTYAIGR
jgi:gamma-glutamyltranspeptidase/glutathione hydrolase